MLNISGEDVEYGDFGGFIIWVLLFGTFCAEFIGVMF